MSCSLVARFSLISKIDDAGAQHVKQIEVTLAHQANILKVIIRLI